MHLAFESRLEPPTILVKWWDAYGMEEGMSLPGPLIDAEVSTGTGMRNATRVNLELWRKPGLGLERRSAQCLRRIPRQSAGPSPAHHDRGRTPATAFHRRPRIRAGRRFFHVAWGLGLDGRRGPRRLDDEAGQ